MPKPFPAARKSPSLVRVSRSLLLASVGLAVSASAASGAATGAGGTEAGDPAAAVQARAAAVPASATPARLSRATIRAVQRRLRVAADGRLGPRTRAAIRRFQRRNDLGVDGRLGERTMVELGVTARAAGAPTAPAPVGRTARLLEAIAACESGGDPTSVSANRQFRGKYQFLESTWETVGGVGDPAAAPEAEQDRRAAALLAAEGTKPWPVCGPKAESAA